MFHILRTENTDLWEEQVDAVANEYGLLNFIVHPDYVSDTAACTKNYSAIFQKYVPIEICGERFRAKSTHGGGNEIRCGWSKPAVN